MLFLTSSTPCVNHPSSYPMPVCSSWMPVMSSDLSNLSWESLLCILIGALCLTIPHPPEMMFAGLSPACLCTHGLVACLAKEVFVESMNEEDHLFA